MESSEEGTKTSERVPTPNVGKESIVGCACKLESVCVNNSYVNLFVLKQMISYNIRCYVSP